MPDKLFAPILLLQGYIIVAVSIIFLCLVAGLLCSINLKMSSRRIKIMGLFYGLSGRSILLLCVACLKLLFVAWCIAFCIELELVHYGVLLTLYIWEASLTLHISEVGVALIWGILLGGGLTAGNFLLAYNRQVRFEWTIEAVYWLLGAFIFTYSVFLFLKSVKKISEGRLTQHVGTQTET